MRKALAISIAIFGAVIAAISTPWIFTDLALLYEANAKIQKQGYNPELASRELAHRINVFSEGVWIMQGVNVFTLALILFYLPKDKN
jgi:hypothetical protein